MLEDHRHDHARRLGRSRRSRQLAPRGRTVRFGLSDEEFAELEAAAARAGQARGAYAAEAALAAARGETVLAAARGETVLTAGDQLADVLAELIRAAGLVRRIGVNLNQAVARLHATGRPSGDLAPYAAESIRRARHLDAVAERVRNALR
jgi:predicted HAD superfamily Cof-like phosphohydrolase